MPERYAKSIKVLFRQLAKNIKFDVILSESTEPETELLLPSSGSVAGLGQHADPLWILLSSEQNSGVT